MNPTHSYVLYQDDLMLIANKPSGIPIHETKDPKRLDFTRMLQSSLGLNTLRTANRLDLLTTGISVFGLDPTRNLELDELLNGCNKYYLALVQGIVNEKQFRIETFLKDGNKKVQTVRSGGKKAITEFKVLAKDEKCNLTLVEAKLITGRRHQIRIHLSEYGYPILGDPIYNSKNESNDIISKICNNKNSGLQTNLPFGNSYLLKSMEEGKMYLHSYKLNFNNLKMAKIDSVQIHESKPNNIGIEANRQNQDFFSSNIESTNESENLKKINIDSTKEKKINIDPLNMKKINMEPGNFISEKYKNLEIICEPNWLSFNDSNLSIFSV